jgi:hypothetical protein
MFPKLSLKRLIGTALVLLVALAVPASYTPAEGVVPQEACASSWCCFELMSICGGVAGLYQNRTGDNCSIRSLSAPADPEAPAPVEQVAG